VGSDRRGVALKTAFGTFVGPDNGILSYIIDRVSEPPGDNQVEPRAQERALLPTAEAVELTQPRFWRIPVSTRSTARHLCARGRSLLRVP
jgi:hypothetical protein